MPFFISLLLLFIPLSSNAEIFTWKDESGVTHFSQEKPNDQPVEKLEVKEQKPATQPGQEIDTEATLEQSEAAQTTEAMPETTEAVQPMEASEQPTEAITSETPAEVMAEQDKPMTESTPVMTQATELEESDNPDSVSK